MKYEALWMNGWLISSRLASGVVKMLGKQALIDAHLQGGGTERPKYSARLFGFVTFLTLGAESPAVPTTPVLAMHASLYARLVLAAPISAEALKTLRSAGIEIFFLQERMCQDSL